MKKDKKVKIGKRIVQFDDIQQTTERNPKPPRKFEGTIQNGTAIVQPNEKEIEE